MRLIGTLSAVFLLGVWAAAQDRLQGPDESEALLGGSKAARIADDRIEWQPRARILRWTIEYGEEKGGTFKAARRVTYEIDFRKATMTDGRRTYRFSEGEQIMMLRALHRYLTEYAVASSEWFVKGGPVRQRERRPPQGEVHL